MKQININNKPFTYQIKRKSIHSIHLHIKGKNSFYISCPYLTPNFVINRFIIKNSTWILKNSKKIFSCPKLSQLKNLGILGKKYKINITKSPKNSFSINHNTSVIQVTANTLYQHHLKKLFEKNLRPLALDLIKKEINAVIPNSFVGATLAVARRHGNLSAVKESPACNVVATAGRRRKKPVIPSVVEGSRRNCKSSLLRPTKISVRNQKTRFGSCSAKGSLSFNWQIIFFPSDKFRHIVLHELVHLKIKNHSKNYWHALSLLDPNCKINNKWLKTHGNHHFLIKP